MRLEKTRIVKKFLRITLYFLYERVKIVYNIHILV